MLCYNIFTPTLRMSQLRKILVSFLIITTVFGSLAPQQQINTKDFDQITPSNISTQNSSKQVSNNTDEWVDNMPSQQIAQTVAPQIIPNAQNENKIDNIITIKEEATKTREQKENSTISLNQPNNTQENQSNIQSKSQKQFKPIRVSAVSAQISTQNSTFNSTQNQTQNSANNSSQNQSQNSTQSSAQNLTPIQSQNTQNQPQGFFEKIKNFKQNNRVWSIIIVVAIAVVFTFLTILIICRCCCCCKTKLDNTENEECPSVIQKSQNKTVKLNQGAPAPAQPTINLQQQNQTKKQCNINQQQENQKTKQAIVHLEKHKEQVPVQVTYNLEEEQQHNQVAYNQEEQHEQVEQVTYNLEQKQDQGQNVTYNLQEQQYNQGEQVTYNQVGEGEVVTYGEGEEVTYNLEGQQGQIQQNYEEQNKQQ